MFLTPPTPSADTASPLALEILSRPNGVRKGRRTSSIPLSALKPRGNSNSYSANDVQSDFDVSAWSESNSYDKFAIDSSGGQSAEVDAFMRALWRTIDRHIAENPFLSEYNHTGQVFVRLEVSAAGQLAKFKLLVSADDRVLKVLALRAIRRALKNETGELHFASQPATVNARFTWSGYQACQRLRGHQKNYLSFCHFAERKRKLFTAGEKIGTYAGAIINNGPWAVEEIQKYNREERHRKTQFNPFEELERDPDWSL